MRRNFLCSLAAMLALAVMAGVSWAGDDNRADLTGSWKLNTELSDDVREVMRSKMPARRGGGMGGGMRGGGGGRGGGAPGGGSFGGPPGGAGMPDMEELRSWVVIEHRGESLSMLSPGETGISLVLNGKDHRNDTPRGEVDVKGKWKGEGLELTIRNEEGRERQFTYSLTAEGRLRVVHNINLPRGGDVEIVSIYDREVDEEVESPPDEEPATTP